jgi:glycosyltransferase involved in cell wall biosynthesis
MKLSVVLATRNEEANIGRCLKSVKDIADEIIIFDEHSSDKTREIAKEYGAKVYLEPHHEIFHVTKQKALEKAKGEWVLQLDADEVVTPQLAKEIHEVTNMDNEQVMSRANPNKKNEVHFTEHQRLIELRDGKIGSSSGNVVAFFIPRSNIFLGHAMRYGGVYPDGVVRLVKNGFARFPQKSVHEQIAIDGQVSWLFNDLEHYDSPTLSRYFARLNRYTDLHADELKVKHVPKNIFAFFNYTLIKPTYTFLNIFLRHKGILDGIPGFLWAFFSATHFPIAYFKYFTNK